MLQQTQVSRVLVKFPEFLALFPDFKHLADAGITDVLRIWQGMGYNRRAKYLHDAAKHILYKDNGVLSNNQIILDKLPGIGIATAGSIACFAYNKPTIFIETNIRRSILFHFFADRKEVDDKELVPILKKCLDVVAEVKMCSYREWYWALMDYGSYLARTVVNPNRGSRHYTKQKPFIGSRRQLRGALIRRYLKGEGVKLKNEKEKEVWVQLKNEGLVE